MVERIGWYCKISLLQTILLFMFKKPFNFKEFLRDSVPIFIGTIVLLFVISSTITSVGVATGSTIVYLYEENKYYIAPVCIDEIDYEKNKNYNMETTLIRSTIESARNLGYTPDPLCVDYGGFEYKRETLFGVIFEKIKLLFVVK